jgi:putative transcription factor
MAECEICGRDTDDLYEVNVEGAAMLACAKCAKVRGKPRRQQLGSAGEKNPPRPAAAASAEEAELVDNYGEVIRKAREALGLPMKVLAERISEKESTLVRIEKQRVPPTEKERRKIERELGIRLLAKAEDKKVAAGPRRDEPISLWDAARKKGKSGE